ncbi:MAG: hypothetical protein EOO01_13175 [Chitinophagaceae bacterium]|nr:MAG: hypothetical protein EOO01_13175 [Chitinophagaceae bacterium]
MQKKMDEGDEPWFNDNGFVALTAAYLLNRGYCCGNGCLNCPYDFKNVPSPKREQLLEKRKQQDEEKSK